MKPTVDSTTAPVEVLAGAVILILGIIVSINRCRRMQRSADSCVKCCARRCEWTLRTFATGAQELDTRRLGLVQPCGIVMRAKNCAKVCIGDGGDRTMREPRSESDERGSSDVVGEVVVSISRSNLRG